MFNILQTLLYGMDVTFLSVREAYLNHPARCRHCSGVIMPREKCIIITFPEEPVSGDIIVLAVFHEPCWSVVEPILEGRVLEPSS
jgi:hypothetical protein